MNWFEALILGIIQGLTEFLPISSSGHLEIGNVLLGIESESNLTFTVAVHGATVLSTIVVFIREIGKIIGETFRFQWNESTQYVVKILISMIPVLMVGLFLEETIESFFSGNMLLVGSMLLITATLLAFTYYAKSGNKKIGYKDAFIIGIAQAFAVMPGISRSGATISTGLLLKNKRENVAQFSFLMVLIPIVGANVKDIMENGSAMMNQANMGPLVIGFLAAFVTGLMACTWMIRIVKQGKLIWFAVYCAVIGLTAIMASFWM